MLIRSMIQIREFLDGIFFRISRGTSCLSGDLLLILHCPAVFSDQRGDERARVSLADDALIRTGVVFRR